MLSVLLAVVSLLVLTLIAILASRHGGWRGMLLAGALLLGWVAWVAIGPKP